MYIVTRPTSSKTNKMKYKYILKIQITNLSNQVSNINNIYLETDTKSTISYH